jgi:hypothetical protein
LSRARRGNEVDGRTPKIVAERYPGEWPERSQSHGGDLKGGAIDPDRLAPLRRLLDFDDFGENQLFERRLPSFFSADRDDRLPEFFV